MEITNATPAQKNGAQAVTLSITFSGPLLFDFIPGFGQCGVSVYAPYCPYHIAGIFASRLSYSETDLWKCVQKQNPSDRFDRAYEIKGDGITRNTGKPVVIGEGQSSFINSEMARSVIRSMPGTKGLCPPKDKILFKFTVPTPDYVYPLYIDKVEIVDGYDTDPNDNNIAPHSSGLRFFYTWDGATPINIVLPMGSTRDVTPPVLDQVAASADIEVRYEGIGLTDENDPHSDSRSCFASLTMLAGVEAWLNYGDGRSSPTNRSHCINDAITDPDPCASAGAQGIAPRIHSGADCHAPIIVNGLL